MNTEILGVILQWVALVVLCYPLGRYIAKVYRGERIGIATLYRKLESYGMKP